jgi:lipopolysaccharide exporter
VSGSKIANGAAWMMAARLADRFAGLVSTTILARVLVPADFGLVAMAMAVISLIDLANSFGFEIPLIRASNPSKDLYNSVWTLNVMFGMFCAVTIALTAYPAAKFYGDDRLLAVMWWLAVGWVAGSLANIGIVDFRRNLEFAKEFRMMMASRVTTLVVTIPCAFYFRSYWALIAGMVAGRAVNTGLSYLWHPFRPRFSLRSGKALFSFSKWIFIEKVAGFGNARAADFLLGRVHGPTALGTFRLADEIGALPGTELIAPINRALLPGAFQMKESGRDFSEITIMATGIVALILVPACLGISAVAEPIVMTMLGYNWLTVVPILKILAISSVPVALWGNQITLLFASGSPRLPGIIAIFRFAIFVPLVFLWVPLHSGLGLAWAILVSSVVAYSIGLYLSIKRFQVSVAQYFGVLWRPVVASLIMLILIRALLFHFTKTSWSIHPFLQLITCIVVGAFAYGAGILVLYRAFGNGKGAEQIILNRLSEILKGRSADLK